MDFSGPIYNLPYHSHACIDMAPADTQSVSDDSVDAGVRDKQTTKSYHFTAKDAVLKESDDGETRVTVPISGVKEDRDGDKFTEDGLKALVDQINEGSIPMFPNHGLDDAGMHSYRFQDIMGRWESAERDGEVVQATATLRDDDPNAESLRDLLGQGMPVGFSVGFGWDEADTEERQEGGLEFDDADLMEVSPVGIPSHPSAVVQAGADMANAMKSAGIDPQSVDADTLAKSIKTSMSNDDTPDESEGTNDEPEPEQDSPDEVEESDETNQLDDETAEAITNAVRGVAESHAEAMVTDVTEAVVEALDADSSDDEDEEGEDDEETEGDDGDGDDDEDDEEMDSAGSEKVAELESTVEELRAELEAVKSDTAESSGRKGGMTPADKDGEPDETDDTDSHSETTERFAEGLI